MKNKYIVQANTKASTGGIHFIADRRFSRINFFQNVKGFGASSSYDFSNLEVYINGELTTQAADSISASADDDIVIKATDDHYPWFGYSSWDSSIFGINYIRSIEEPFPLMHQANGNPITDFSKCFQGCSNLVSLPEGLFDNNTQITDFYACFENCSGLTNIPLGLFNKNTQVTSFTRCFYNCSNLIVNVQIGSIASSVEAVQFAKGTKEKGTVYCRAGSAAYTAFSQSTAGANVNVKTY